VGGLIKEVCLQIVKEHKESGGKGDLQCRGKYIAPPMVDHWWVGAIKEK
jgi:hypothetical protein